jgi:hypothetical protein
MDLIYTNAARVDLGVLKAYAFDMSFGAKENDFEMTLGAKEPMLDFGAFAYFEGTEYGGIVDGRSTSTSSESITYTGRTWHGVLNSKIIEPDPGADYLIVSGDANEILAILVDRLNLGGLFTASAEESGITIKNNKFTRYCKAYDGICDMLQENGAKLKMRWENRTVTLYAEPIVDYTSAPVDGDMAELEVEQHRNKINHLICLGKGNLADREVIHLYVDQFGRIGDVQYYTGLDEYAETYSNTNAESSDELRSEGIKRLKELRDTDVADISMDKNDSFPFDIGDLVGASDIKSGNHVTASVTQKIVKIKNGVVSTEYQTGG